MCSDSQLITTNGSLLTRVDLLLPTDVMATHAVTRKFVRGEPVVTSFLVISYMLNTQNMSPATRTPALETHQALWSRTTRKGSQTQPSSR